MSPDDDRDQRDALYQLADDGNPHAGTIDDMDTLCLDSLRNSFSSNSTSIEPRSQQ
jgi:hypothetical protein